MHIRLGTRGSRLAVAQSEWVKKQLENAYPSHTFELVTIETKGDRIQNRALDKIGDKGIFVKEIEQQILEGTIDIGVHSMKDMPSQLPDALMFTKTWKREDARDVLILKEAASLQSLPAHAVIATGSKRRTQQLMQLREDLDMIGIRGNLDTRLRKLKETPMHGLVMAAAGFHRLGLQHCITAYLSPEEMVPACAQGALALEIRKDRVDLLQLLDALSDEESDCTVRAERTFLAQVNGSCHLCVGAYCERTMNGYRMYGVLGDEAGTHLFRECKEGTDPQFLAKCLASSLCRKVKP